MPKDIKFKRTSNIQKLNFKWIILLLIIAFILSGLFDSFSSSFMSVVHISIAAVIILLLIIIGIVFDIIGIAVATAVETPFHSMSARKVRGAKEAIFLIRNAEKVASLCNDVVGDITGIVSGTAAAEIVLKIRSYNVDIKIISLVVTGIVASLTVGGKAMGKAFAIRNSNTIVYYVAYILSFFLKSK